MANTPQYGVGQYGSSQYGSGEVSGDSAGLLSVGHQVEVDAIVRAQATSLAARSVFNQFDEHGLVVGLPRLRGEPNWQYKRRILDVFANRAGAHYRGLVNGITRELGLELFSPMQLNPRRSLSTGKFFAPDPYIQFDGVWIYLYSDYAGGVLDHKIDRYAGGGNYEHLGRLVDFINQTTYFEASLESPDYYYLKSMTIINQSNRLLATAPLEPSPKQKLPNSRIVESSVLFSDLETLHIKASDASQVNQPGEYYLDTHNGILTTHRAPPADASARYEYTEFPFKPLASPVILHNINDDNFRVKMFDQVLQDDGSFSHGLPTEIGVDIVNELMSVVPMYWGI